MSLVTISKRQVSNQTNHLELFFFPSNYDLSSSKSHAFYSSGAAVLQGGLYTWFKQRLQQEKEHGLMCEKGTSRRELFVPFFGRLGESITYLFLALRVLVSLGCTVFRLPFQCFFHKEFEPPQRALALEQQHRIKAINRRLRCACENETKYQKEFNYSQKKLFHIRISSEMHQNAKKYTTRMWKEAPLR